MKNTPYKQISFRTDANKDVTSFFCFVVDAEYDGGRSLEWAVLDKYPECKTWFADGTFVGKRSDVVRFVKEKYAEHADIIDTNLASYEQKWRVVEPKFHELVRGLFGTHPWPKGKYVAYPTIWGMFPRFLDNKTFQLPFKFRNKRYVNVVIAHEMLHFIFYDYFFKHYPKYEGDDYDMLSWHVSEIFNTVVQNSEPWLKVFSVPTMGYPEHEKIVARLSRIHTGKDGWRTDDLIRDILVEAEKLV